MASGVRNDIRQACLFFLLLGLIVISAPVGAGTEPGSDLHDSVVKLRNLGQIGFLKASVSYKSDNKDSELLTSFRGAFTPHWAYQVVFTNSSGAFTWAGFDGIKYWLVSDGYLTTLSLTNTECLPTVIFNGSSALTLLLAMARESKEKDFVFDLMTNGVIHYQCSFPSSLFGSLSNAVLRAQSSIRNHAPENVEIEGTLSTLIYEPVIYSYSKFVIVSDNYVPTELKVSYPARMTELTYQLRADPIGQSKDTPIGEVPAPNRVDPLSSKKVSYSIKLEVKDNSVQCHRLSGTTWTPISLREATLSSPGN